MQTQHNSRRQALQQLLLGTAGIGFLPLLSKASAVHNYPTDPLKPFMVSPAAPLQPGPGGLEIRTLIHSSTTNQQISCVEFAVAPKKMGPAPHYHKALDELMYVLEGSITVMVEDKFYEIPAGGWHLRPRGLVHTFFNQTNQPVRAIDMYFNQNFEDYLEEIFHKIPAEVKEKNLSFSDPAIVKKMKELHEQFGLVGFPEKKQAIIDQFGLTA